MNNTAEELKKKDAYSFNPQWLKEVSLSKTRQPLPVHSSYVAPDQSGQMPKMYANAEERKKEGGRERTGATGRGEQSEREELRKG